MCLKKMDLWKVLIDLYFLSQHLGIRNIVLLFFLVFVRSGDCLRMGTIFHHHLG